MSGKMRKSSRESYWEKPQEGLEKVSLGLRGNLRRLACALRRSQVLQNGQTRIGYPDHVKTIMRQLICNQAERCDIYRVQGLD